MTDSGLVLQADKDNLRKTMTHEIGHCINLAHPSTSEASVMKQGWNLSWKNYDMPQSFDIHEPAYVSKSTFDSEKSQLVMLTLPPE